MATLFTLDLRWDSAAAGIPPVFIPLERDDRPLTKWPSSKYKQNITLWKKTGHDAFGGAIFDTPICFKGKWEDEDGLFVNQAGEEQRTDSIVWVSCDVEVGDYLYHGQSTVLDPTAVVDASEIRETIKIPGWKSNQWTEVRAML